jgi:hypothetical protein
LRKLCRQGPDAVAQNDRRQFYTEGIRQMPGLAHQFERRIFQPPLVLLGENPHLTLSIHVYHCLVSRIAFLGHELSFLRKQESIPLSPDLRYYFVINQFVYHV